MGQENQPINCVTWSQAVTFCTGFTSPKRRLPGQGEWMYAALGPQGHMSMYPWGNDAPMLPDSGVPQLSCDQLSYGQLSSTCRVGSYMATLLGNRTSTINTGVKDLFGNVNEWTNYQYHDPYVSQESVCVLGMPCPLLGGSWHNNRRVQPADPRGYYNDSGFRCARNAP
jgi:formylglycine-generating enzyme required for sulfatase activity